MQAIIYIKFCIALYLDMVEVHNFGENVDIFIEYSFINNSFQRMAARSFLFVQPETCHSFDVRTHNPVVQKNRGSTPAQGYFMQGQYCARFTSDL